MLGLIFLIIFVLSFLGMLFIVFKKWPELKAVSILGQSDIVERPFAERTMERMKNLRPIKNFSSEKILKKFFIRLKILLSKGEKRVDKYLHKVSHSQKFEDNYWEKVRKEK
ncbi:hypothetical protein KKC63_01240 [Patescibacteria group bacterium]|nr:hypothetical protein [Patescibacteria group bacterium]MBU4023241.1 hypothetical protein [Patescibacteria group bacterium]MBU4078520.1 hypothetical protein [Patescibacteria group bacterium]